MSDLQVKVNNLEIKLEKSLLSLEDKLQNYFINETDKEKYIEYLTQGKRFQAALSNSVKNGDFNQKVSNDKIKKLQLINEYCNILDKILINFN